MGDHQNKPTVRRAGWGLVGEAAKWVPASDVRIRGVTSSSPGSAAKKAEQPPVVVRLAGAVGEHVTFGFVDFSETTKTTAQVPRILLLCLRARCFAFASVHLALLSARLRDEGAAPLFLPPGHSLACTPDLKCSIAP